MRKRSNPGERVGDQRRVASIPEATGHKVGQAEAVLHLAQQQQPTVRGDQATVEGRRHLLATDGWKIEGKKGIVGHGGCGPNLAPVERCLDNKFLHDM